MQFTKYVVKPHIYLKFNFIDRWMHINFDSILANKISIDLIKGEVKHFGIWNLIVYEDGK